jgi:N-acyl-D-aspartate/D-glutamate deacylase
MTGDGAHEDDKGDPAMFDVVIRGGSVVDGSGAAPVIADVGVRGDRIAAVGRDLAAGGVEIDATDRIVTPGFVDVHTHYDGQATWDEELAPSTPHGVTTVVMGNCGVGFAPVRPGREQFLVELMEGVEDIPGAALNEGMTWGWESFEEYLDVLAGRRWTADVGAMIAHGALRAYVMGDSGARNEPATATDIARMAELVASAIEAGAMGFSTSRTIGHRSVSGDPVPGTFAAEDELFAIGRAVAEVGRGVFEVAPSGIVSDDHVAPESEIEWMCRLGAETGVPVTYLQLQYDWAPDSWRKHLDLVARARERGVDITAQVAARPFGVLLGLGSRHRFLQVPSFEPLVDLTPAKTAERMREPELRQRLLAESRALVEMLRDTMPTAAQLLDTFDRTYPLGDPVDYEQGYERSFAGIAAAEGRDPLEVYYDALLERDGQAISMMTLFGNSEGNGDALLQMLAEPGTVIGLADGGAHCNMICDASTPTWTLTHWVRDRQGARLPLEAAVKKMTADTADLFRLHDRGRISEGRRADLNVIDLDRLTLREPHLVADLPAGGTRFLQDAEGYDHTIVAGEVTRSADAFTGARPGRLLRGH